MRSDELLWAGKRGPWIQCLALTHIVGVIPSHCLQGYFEVRGHRYVTFYPTAFNVPFGVLLLFDLIRISVT